MIFVGCVDLNTSSWLMLWAWIITVSRFLLIYPDLVIVKVPWLCVCCVLACLSSHCPSVWLFYFGVSWWLYWVGNCNYVLSFDLHFITISMLCSCTKQSVYQQTLSSNQTPRDWVLKSVNVPPVTIIQYSYPRIIYNQLIHKGPPREIPLEPKLNTKDTKVYPTPLTEDPRILASPMSTSDVAQLYDKDTLDIPD